MEGVSSNSNKKYFLALGGAAVATLLFAIKNIYQRVPLAEFKNFAGIKKHSLVILEAATGLTGLVAAALGLRGKSKTETKDPLQTSTNTIEQKKEENVKEEKIEATEAYDPERHLLENIKTWDAGAIAYLEKFAESDPSGDAEYKLGCAFYRGQEVVQNQDIAISHWEKAADKGNMNAQYQLGMHYMAPGANQDIPKGTNLIEKACNGGNKKAQGMIALCYYSYGAQKLKDGDKQQYYTYLVMATKVDSSSSNQAQVLAKKCLSDAFDKLTKDAYPQEAGKVSDTAVKEIKTMAECGYVDAMLQTGVNQLMGYGCNQQEEEGKKWIERYMQATNKDVTETKKVISPNVAMKLDGEELMIVNTSKSIPLPWEIDHHKVLTAVETAFPAFEEK